MSATDQGAGPGRWDNLRREALVAAGLVAGFVIIYLPGILLNTIGTPDDHKIFWVGDSKECCFSAWDSQNWAYIGRALGGLIANIQFGFIRELSDLAPVRIFSAVWTALGCFTIYLYLRRELPMVPALMVAVGICMVPAFFLGIIWAHAFAFLTVPPFLAFWAGVIAVDRPAFLGGRIGSALIAGLIFIATLYMYQPSAMFFVLPMVLTILFFRKFPEASILPRTIWVIGIFVVASAIYYAVHRYIFLPKFIAAYPNWADESSHARFVLLGAENATNIVKDALRKLNDLLVMTIIAFNGIWPVPQKGIAGIFAIVILFGLAIFGRGEQTGGVTTRQVSWPSVLAVTTLALFTTAPTIAAAGGYTPVRIASAYAAVALSILFWSMFRIFSGKLRSITQLAAIFMILLFPLIQGIALVSNATARVTYDSVKALLSQYAGKPISKILVIGPTRYGLNPFGFPTGNEVTSVTATRLSIDLALAEMGYKYGSTFEYTEILKLTDAFGVSDNDAVVDLRYLDTAIPRGFQKYRLLGRPSVNTRTGRCESSVGPANLVPPVSNTEWGFGHLVMMPSREGIVPIVSVPGSPLQRITRRVHRPNGALGDRLVVRLSTQAKNGASEVGLRFTLYPKITQIFTDVPIENGEWNCITAVFDIPVAFDFADFFIYPSTTASDKGLGLGGLETAIADVGVFYEDGANPAHSLAPLRMWKLTPRDHSAANVSNLIDRKPESVWRVTNRESVELLLELPEHSGSVSTFELTFASDTRTKRPQRLDVIALTEAGGGVTIASEKLSDALEVSKQVITMPPDAAYGGFVLRFFGNSPEWGLAEISPTIVWK